MLGSHHINRKTKTMPILNYTTTIDVGKTAGEMQTLMTRRGVRSVSTIINDEGVPSGIAFQLTTEYGTRYFEFPVRLEGVYAAIKKDPKIVPSKRTPEQANRVAWRIAREWLVVQLAMVDAELASMDEIMLPYLTDNNGKSLYSEYRRNQLAAIEE